jgi:hypothetical protein
MDSEPIDIQSHLFTVRVWQEDMGDGLWEWRGKVQRVYSGEAFYFREWQELIAHLTSLLQEGNSNIVESRSY